MTGIWTHATIAHVAALQPVACATDGTGPVGRLDLALCRVPWRSLTLLTSLAQRGKRSEEMVELGCASCGARVGPSSTASSNDPEGRWFDAAAHPDHVRRPHRHRPDRAAHYDGWIGDICSTNEAIDVAGRLHEVLTPLGFLSTITPSWSRRTTPSPRRHRAGRGGRRHAHHDPAVVVLRRSRRHPSTRRSTRCNIATARTSAGLTSRADRGYSDSRAKTIAGVIVLSMESFRRKNRDRHRHQPRSRCGIAHALLAEGGDCRRMLGRTGCTPRTDDNPDWAGPQCTVGVVTRAMSRPSTPSQRASSTPTAASTSCEQRRRNGPHPARRGRPRVGPEDPGRPRAADDFERTALFHAFAVQMNLISPMWFAIRVARQMKTQEGTGSIVNISSGAGQHRRTDPRLPRRGQPGLNHMTRSLAQEWGTADPRQLRRAGSDDHRQLPLFVRPPTTPPDASTSTCPDEARRRARRGRGHRRVPVRRRGLHQRHDHRVRRRHAPRVLYDAGLKTITDLL